MNKEQNKTITLNQNDLLWLCGLLSMQIDDKNTSYSKEEIKKMIHIKGDLKK